MENEDKELLLRDLCTRLLYAPMVNVTMPGVNVELNEPVVSVNVHYEFCTLKYSDGTYYISCVRPYLRPLSSMSEIEIEELLKIRTNEKFANIVSDCQDFYCRKYLDYHHLIEKGLALEAPKGMYDVDNQ